MGKPGFSRTCSRCGRATGPRRPRDAIANELQYLREKEWRVFSWASSIQLGIIGGGITVAGMHGFPLPLPHRLLLGTASLILTLYSFVWIRQCLKREENTLNILNKYDADLLIESTRWSIKTFEYLLTILMIGTAVLLTIWLVEVPLAVHSLASTVLCLNNETSS